MAKYTATAYKIFYEYVDIIRLTQINLGKKYPQKKEAFLWDGDPQHKEDDDLWYGINGFFKWLEKKTYKCMCGSFFLNTAGTLNALSVKVLGLNGKLNFGDGMVFRLQTFIPIPLSDLSNLLENIQSTQNPKIDLPLDAIRTRLRYLRDVGLEYLKLKSHIKKLE